MITHCSHSYLCLSSARSLSLPPSLDSGIFWSLRQRFAETGDEEQIPANFPANTETGDEEQIPANFPANTVGDILQDKKMDASAGHGSGIVDISQNYKLGKTLGIGSFGKVKIAEHALTGHKVAIKILNRRKIKNIDMEEKVRREIKILRLFTHPHIIRLYEVIETLTDIYVVMEYCKSGELFDYIVEKGLLQEDEARKFFQQIISGVEYCHRNMVVHRDLKPENLLLDSKCNVKISEFGLCNIIRDGHLLKTSCGSPNYAAPEVISGKLYAGPEVDVWSCGVILYALLCGTLPFDDENTPNLFKKVKGGIYNLPSHISPGARDLISRMLVVDPMKRMTIPEIRQHVWFQAHLPRYLAVPPPDTMPQAKKIDEDILLKVVKMGFDRNSLVDYLRNQVQNEGTVAYYLLLDNCFRASSGYLFRASSGYLGAEFQESMEYGLNRMSPNDSAASTVGPRSPGYMEYQGMGSRPQFPAEKKWALGLQLTGAATDISLKGTPHWMAPEVMEETVEGSSSEKRRSESSASSNLVDLNMHSDQMGVIDTSRRMEDPKSRGDEDLELLQLQVHQYCTGDNAPEEDVLSMGELVNQTESFYEEPLEILLGELEETPKDPREFEELNCDPLKVPPTIPHHFSILHVLDLSYTEINSLPQSISRLVALKKLFLRSCEFLMELPPEIGELTNLEVLDLEGTEILCLPKEIAKLVNLTCLKVSLYGYANQTVIPRRVLSNLSRLIELIIDVTPHGEWWDVEVEAIIDDLCSLKELTTLKLSLPTAELLKNVTVFRHLANFRFTVGRYEEHFISRLPHDVGEEFNKQKKLDKGLKYINGSRIPNEITEVFKHANAFFLQRHWTAKSLSEFGHENMNEVKYCLVMECNEFRTIIDSEQFYQGKDGRSESEDFQDFDEAIVLGSIEKLIIYYMKNMESFWKGPVGKGSLSNLKSLALHTCPKLTTLFIIDVLSNLINLEELIVADCPKIDSLVSLKSSSSKSGLFLRSLKKISLLELPELVSISSGLCIAPNLERMVIFYCPKLEKLSSMDVSSTKLKVIKGEKEWWDALKWYESDLSTKHEDYLAHLFIPLRRDGDLMAQLTKD